MNKKTIFSALLSLGLLTGSARADEAVLKASKGIVKIRPAAAKKYRVLKIGQKIRANDQVKVGPASLAQVDFPGGATLLVKENSRFKVRRDARGQLVSFKIGEFLIGLKRKLTGAERFRVKTPVAVASVRGTVFWGKSDEKLTTTYACFTGSIDIKAKGKHVVLEPGQTTTIEVNQPPAAPQASAIPKDYINTFEIDGSLADVDNQIEKETVPEAQ